MKVFGFVENLHPLSFKVKKVKLLVALLRRLQKAETKLYAIVSIFCHIRLFVVIGSCISGV